MATAPHSAGLSLVGSGMPSAPSSRRCPLLPFGNPAFLFRFDPKLGSVSSSGARRSSARGFRHALVEQDSRLRRAGPSGALVPGDLLITCHGSPARWHEVHVIRTPLSSRWQRLPGCPSVERGDPSCHRITSDAVAARLMGVVVGQAIDAMTVMSRPCTHRIMPLPRRPCWRIVRSMAAKRDERSRGDSDSASRDGSGTDTRRHWNRSARAAQPRDTLLGVRRNLLGRLGHAATPGRLLLTVCPCTRRRA